METHAPYSQWSENASRELAVVVTVVVLPASGNLFVGDQLQLSAQLLGANDEVLDAPLAWTSSNAAAAEVDQTGLVSAVGAGTTTITATAPSGALDTVSLTVAARLYQLTPSGWISVRAVHSMGELGFARATQVYVRRGAAWVRIL